MCPESLVSVNSEEQKCEYFKGMCSQLENVLWCCPVSTNTDLTAASRLLPPARHLPTSCIIHLLYPFPILQSPYTSVLYLFYPKGKHFSLLKI